LYYCDIMIPEKIRINTVLRSYCNQDWFWDTRRKHFQDMDLWVILDGHGKIETPHGVFSLQGGDSFVLRPGEGYLATHDPKRPLYVVASHFDFLGAHGVETHPALEVPPPFYHHLEFLPFCIELLERMLGCWVEDDRTGAAFWLLAVLRERERQIRQSTLAQPAGKLARQIDILCRGIRANPQKLHRVADLARRTHCSRHHFARVFRAIKGVSPSEFIIGVRVETAKALLLASSHSIGRIAELAGYRDVYFFSRQFRRVTGFSPLAFRRGMGHPATG
jgi:AraC-like DNA-binding protein